MKIIKYLICLVALSSIISCSKESEKLLKDDFLLKTVSPAVVGESLEFAYAMATADGSLKSATAEASIAGAPGTGFDTKSYHVDSRGNDIGVVVADTSTQSNISAATYSADTSMATLRYKYIVPAEASGQSISITFQAESSGGEIVSTTTPLYKISEMDLKRNIIMTNDNACYFSIENMMAYTEAEVIAQGLSDKIDLVYLYDALSIDGFAFGHALVSPGADEKYLNGRIIPDGFKKNKTKIEKQVFIKDMQLSGTLPATFVDDIDLKTLDLSYALDFALGISSKNSAFIETEDGRYRAYLYFNEAKSRKLTFGIKRLEIK